MYLYHLEYSLTFKFHVNFHTYEFPIWLSLATMVLSKHHGLWKGPHQGKFEGRNLAHGLFFHVFFQKNDLAICIYWSPLSPNLWKIYTKNKVWITYFVVLIWDKKISLGPIGNLYPSKDTTKSSNHHAWPLKSLIVSS